MRASLFFKLALAGWALLAVSTSARKHRKRGFTSNPGPAPTKRPVITDAPVVPYTLIGSGTCEEDFLQSASSPTVNLAYCQNLCSLNPSCDFMSVLEAGTLVDIPGFCQLYGEFTTCTSRVQSGLLTPYYLSYQWIGREPWEFNALDTGVDGMCYGDGTPSSAPLSNTQGVSLSDCMGICIAEPKCYAISFFLDECLTFNTHGCIGVEPFSSNTNYVTYGRATRSAKTG